MEGCISNTSIPNLLVDQIIPQGDRVSLVVDDEYLSRISKLHSGSCPKLCFGNKKLPFNCVKFAGCNVSIRSLAVFAQTVIIEDSNFVCEEIYFNLKNELEISNAKLQFSIMKADAKFVNFESYTVLDGNELGILAGRSISLGGGEFVLKHRLSCRAQGISIERGCVVYSRDIILSPSTSLDLRGKLNSTNLFIAGYDAKVDDVVRSSAKIVSSHDFALNSQNVSLLTSNDVVLSGRIVVDQQLDCATNRGHVEVAAGCDLSTKVLRIQAQSVFVDERACCVGGSELISFLTHGRFVLSDFSVFQFEKLLTIDCRSLERLDKPITSTFSHQGQSQSQSKMKKSPTFRNGDVWITSKANIDLGGGLKCKQLVVNCQRHQHHDADVIFRKSARFDVDTLLIRGKGSIGDEETPAGESQSESGRIVFESGSIVLSSKIMSIETDKTVVMKGLLKRDLLCCSSNKVTIHTSKSIEFVNCSVDVGEAQLWFGDELILEDGARVAVSGKLFLLHHLLQQSDNAGGVLRLSNDSLLVARKEIVCRFAECYIEGCFASQEESILMGYNHNQDSKKKKMPNETTTVEKKVRIKEAIQNVVDRLKSSSSQRRNPLQSLLSKFHAKRTELVSSIQRIIRLKSEEEEAENNSKSLSFVMKYIFISGKVRARKTVILVSRDISIQNVSSIKCNTTSESWENSAILMYSNRSTFLCGSELDASTVVVVSPIVFQLVCLIKAHNLSISAVAVFRLASLCNSTKTMLKAPLILSGLNVVAPNVNKTLQKMRADLVEKFVDVHELIEKLAEARMENNEFEVFLIESLRVIKEHSHMALLHSLEFVHFVFQIVNLLVPNTTLLITVNVMSIIRATVFLLFSVKSIHKSIKRYLTRERHNFILVEIVGEGMFSLYQVVGVLTNFGALFQQIKHLRSSATISAVNSSSSGVLSLKQLHGSILDRTREIVSNGPLSALSSTLRVFDTFVLNDYTKYAVGLFSYLPSSMSFSIFNLSGEFQMGMYVVNGSSACSLNGSVVVLSYNCSATDLASIRLASNVVICNGTISETSAILGVDRGVKITQSSLILAGGKRIHAGGYHFGESVVLKTKKFNQQKNNKLVYNKIGGVSVNQEWNLSENSEFRPISSKSHHHSSFSLAKSEDESRFASFNGNAIAESVEEHVQSSGNVIKTLSVGVGSTFFLKDTALKIDNVSGGIVVKNVQMKVSELKLLSSVKIAGGTSSFVSTGINLDIIDLSIHLTGNGHVNIFSPTTNVNGETYGEGNVAFFNAEIGENVHFHHRGNVLIELKNGDDLSSAIAGQGKYSKIANVGQVNFKINGHFVHSSENLQFGSSEETPNRERQDIGIVAESIDIFQEVVRRKGVQLFSTEDDVVIRNSVISLDGSVIINADKGNVLIEDNIEKGTIVTKCRIKCGDVQQHHCSSSNSSVVVVGKEKSRLDCPTDGRSNSPVDSFVFNEVGIIKNVEKIELKAKDSVVITSREGRVRFDPCNIHGDQGVVVEGKEGVLFTGICVTSVKRKKSGNPFYSGRKKVIREVAETSCITSNGDISIISDSGTVITNGINVESLGGGYIHQRGREGIYNESVVTKTTVSEKKLVLGGLVAKEQREEKHDTETPCVFSANGIYLESEAGDIVNIGMIATGNEVASFKAENVVFERRVLNHEITVIKKGFDLSMSLFGADIFQSSTSFFENLKTEFLEYHLPPIGNSPITVARSIREGNVPEIAANLVNALLIPGNLRFIIDVQSPFKFGLKYRDYEFHRHNYDTLGEGMIEMDFISINATNVVKFGSAFGFSAGGVEIEARTLIESGTFLNYEIEDFSSGVALGFDPLGSNEGILQCCPSLSADLSTAKELSSIAVCQIGNAAIMKVNVDEWHKIGSQSFAETLQGRVGSIFFDSTFSVSEGKTHGISLGTASLGLSDGHSKASLLTDQTGIYAVYVDGFQVKNVHLRSSRCAVRGTDQNVTNEITEYEKVSGTHLGVDFANFISMGVVSSCNQLAFAFDSSGEKISKIKGLGIERKNYAAIIQNSFESVSESEFHYRAIEFNQHNGGAEEERRDGTEHPESRRDFSVEDMTSENEQVHNIRSTFLDPMKKVVKDRSHNLKFHYDHSYHLRRSSVVLRETLRKEVAEEGILPCLDDVAFDDANPLLLDSVLDIFYDPSTSELDKYTQLLFYWDDEKTCFSELNEEEKQGVLVYQSYVKEGGDFRDVEALNCFFEERKQELSDEYAKKSMKSYVRENYPDYFFDTELYNVHKLEDVQRIFIDCKLAFEPDDPMVLQMTFEMNQYFAEKMYNASWAELSTAQQNEVSRLREHSIMFQQQQSSSFHNGQDDKDVDFEGWSEFCSKQENMLVEYFAKHGDPDTSYLTSCGILPVELLKESRPAVSEYELPYLLPKWGEDQNGRRYPLPGSGLFFLLAHEKNGWEGACELFSMTKDCIRDHFSYFLAGKPTIEYTPTQREIYIDKSLRSFFSLSLDFVPLVNGIKWAFQGITGYNPITKHDLAWDERAFDLTFSLFYVPFASDVIIGYGKAVWETVKGVGKLGKTLIRNERKLKGVCSTVRATGMSAIDSIAVPMERLGREMEMLMLWGFDRGTSSAKSAGAWFSSKMKKAGGSFWKSGSYGGRNWKIVASSRNTTRSFAFAGAAAEEGGVGMGKFSEKPLMSAVKKKSSARQPPIISSEKGAKSRSKNVSKVIRRRKKTSTKSQVEKESGPKVIIRKKGANKSSASTTSFPEIVVNKETGQLSKAILGVAGKRGPVINVSKKSKIALPQQRPTHFFSLPLGHHMEVRQLQRWVSTLYPEVARDLLFQAVSNKYKFHMTMGVFPARSRERLEVAKGILGEIEPVLKELFPEESYVEFDKITTFRDRNLEKCRVLYLSPKKGEMSEKLLHLHESITEMLIREKFMEKPRVKKKAVLHATLFNAKFSRQFRFISDPSRVLDAFASLRGTVWHRRKIPLKHLELNHMAKVDNETRYYAMEGRILFPRPYGHEFALMSSTNTPKLKTFINKKNGSGGSDKESEFITKLTKDGKSNGQKVLRGEAHEKGLWHESTHTWITTKEGVCLLQRRSHKKLAQPGLFDVGSAGHIVHGETPVQSAIAEVAEELGLKLTEQDLRKIGTYQIAKTHETDLGTYFDNEFYHVFHVELETIDLPTLKLQKSEVEGVALMHWQDVERNYLRKDPRFVLKHMKRGGKDSDYLNELFGYLAKRYGTKKDPIEQVHKRRKAKRREHRDGIIEYRNIGTVSFRHMELVRTLRKRKVMQSQFAIRAMLAVDRLLFVPSSKIPNDKAKVFKRMQQIVN